MSRMAEVLALLEFLLLAAVGFLVIRVGHLALEVSSAQNESSRLVAERVRASSATERTSGEVVNDGGVR